MPCQAAAAQVVTEFEYRCNSTGTDEEKQLVAGWLFGSSLGEGEKVQSWQKGEFKKGENRQ